MNQLRTLPLAALLLGIAACSDAPSAVAPAPSLAKTAASTGGSTTGQYLVRFRGNGVPADFASQVSALGGEVIFTHAGAGVAAVAGLTDDAASELAAKASVAAVDADAYTTVAPIVDGEGTLAADDVASPTNPTEARFFGRQWNMQAISAPAAWAAGEFGKPSVKVGILDTGIDYLHPDLVGRVDLALSRSFLSAAENARVQAAFPGANPIADLHYHGTHVSATVVSNAYLAAGVTSQITLVGLKVCAPGTAPSFSGTCPTSGTLAAILYAADNGLDVINMSLGGEFKRVEASARGGNGPSFLATINQVMNYANRKGTAIVVSAGNSAIDLGRNRVPDDSGNYVKVSGLYASYCDAPAVICVSATGPTKARLVPRFPGDTRGQYVDIENIDALASYSNFGRGAVDVAAPGGNAIPVWAACSGFTIVTPLLPCRSRVFNSPTSWSGSVVGLSGTSMAAPHVTGLAALIAGRVGHDPAQIAAVLQQSADDLGQPGTDPAYGKGRINVANALGLD